MNRPHLRWCDYDNYGDILPDGYKRLKNGKIVDTTEMTDEEGKEFSCSLYSNCAGCPFDEDGECTKMDDDWD